MQHDLMGSMVSSVQSFAIDVKGGGKATKDFYKAIRGRVLPSMPKGEIVGNVVIGGKGIGKETGAAPKLSIRKKRQRG